MPLLMLMGSVVNSTQAGSFQPTASRIALGLARESIYCRSKGRGADCGKTLAIGESFMALLRDLLGLPNCIGSLAFCRTSMPRFCGATWSNWCNGSTPDLGSGGTVQFWVIPPSQKVGVEAREVKCRLYGGAVN